MLLLQGTKQSSMIHSVICSRKLQEQEKSPNLGSYKITKNGQEIIGLSNNSVTTPDIANNAVTNDKILSLDYSKLTNIPANPENKISTLQVDANLNMGNNTVTSNAQVINYSQLVPKSYISGEQLYPPIVTSLVACYSLYK